MVHNSHATKIDQISGERYIFEIKRTGKRAIILKK